MIKRVALLLALCAFAIVAMGIMSAQTACAHDPRFACSPRDASNPVRIPDATKSWAYYGKLKAGTADYYTFEMPVAARVPISILLDVRDAGNPARPVVDLYDRANRRVTELDLHRPIAFYEPFSRVNYFSSQERSVPLKPGAYIVKVRMQQGNEPQRYSLAIGTEERFSVLEIPYVFGAVLRIHNRAF